MVVVQTQPSFLLHRYAGYLSFGHGSDLSGNRRQLLVVNLVVRQALEAVGKEA
jgi:hypothetical protein